MEEGSKMKVRGEGLVDERGMSDTRINSNHVTNPEGHGIGPAKADGRKVSLRPNRKRHTNADSDPLIRLESERKAIRDEEELTYPNRSPYPNLTC